MGGDPTLIPATGIRLADAMAAWWQRYRPAEAEALAWWEAEIQASAATGMAAGDTATVRGATEALGRFRRADDTERGLIAQRAALTLYSQATAAFTAILASGALTARILHDGRECTLPASFWISTEFMIACWHRPAIYLDREEFAAWREAASAAPTRVPFSDLVAFLASRAPAGTAAPSELDDWQAAKTRFGTQISRTEIRDARSTAYADRRPGRGRPRNSVS